jgi:7,8-dihydro-6-hydroxymethylpterin-pyrophosphokinase
VHERAFVLVPWLDVDPDAVLPGHGRVADLPVDRSAVRRVGEL